MRVHHLTKPILASLCAGLFGNVAGFWRMPCRGRVGLARLDPLISFDEIAAHVHSVHGSSGFSKKAGYKELTEGQCTSCQVSQDKSAYWHPALYFQAADGKFTLVEQIGGMLAYYLLNYSPGSTSITAFPEGFEMLAGDTFQRNFTYPVPDVEKSLWVGEFAEQAFLRQAAIGFNCLNYQKQPEGTLYRHFLPDKAFLDANCIDGVRFEVMFPSCWNGKDVTAKDKKSHVAYPSQVMAGTCPDGFPERLPSLLYETIWGTNAFAGKDGKFVIANGDPTGFGYHADFMTGWDPNFLQKAVDECTNLSGNIEDCPIFDIQSSKDSTDCTIDLPKEIENEEVLKNLGSLPGDVQIHSGPAYAAGAKAKVPVPTYNAATTSSVMPAPVLPYTPGLPLPSSDSSVPGAIYAATPVAASSPPAPPPPNYPSSPTPATMTPSPAVYSAAGAAEKLAPPPTPVTSPPRIPAPAPATEGVYSTASSTRDGVVQIMEYYLDVVTVTVHAYQHAKRHVHKHRRGGHHV
ncbi:hypothetical protein PZA11_005607 [Diplocarpon coronariae]